MIAAFMNRKKFDRHLKKSGKSEEEIEFIRTFTDRTRFAYWFFKDPSGGPWLAREYQRESLNSWASRKVHVCGRDVGKTSEIEIFLLWAAFCCANKEGMLATQLENHLVPTMERIIAQIESNPRLRELVVSIRRKPSYRIVFKTPFILWGKIAGPRGANFQNTHVDYLCVDEAQSISEEAWGELHQSLNHGGWRWVYGVPNGVRNTFYRLSRQKRRQEIYHWPSTINPDFNEERKQELIYLYGGEESSGYQHQVLGLHGSAEHGVFDHEQYANCVRSNFKYQETILGKKELAEYNWQELLNLPETPSRGPVFLGGDLGYAQDPTELVLWQATAEGKFINFYRLSLSGATYDLQQKIIYQLYKSYNLSSIGLDRGAAGQAVCHNIMAAWPEMSPLMGRGHDGQPGYNFGSKTITGFDEETGKPLLRPTKQFMTDLIQEGLRTRRSIYFPSAQREEQYLNHTYKLGAQGMIVYRKGDDHIIDADRAAHLAWYQFFNQVAAVGDCASSAVFEEL